ncbi:hypothetical protein Ancab_038139 [Ancistrocladus abbreviatus]
MIGSAPPPKEEEIVKEPEPEPELMELSEEEKEVKERKENEAGNEAYKKDFETAIHLQRKSPRGRKIQSFPLKLQCRQFHGGEREPLTGNRHHPVRAKNFYERDNDLNNGGQSLLIPAPPPLPPWRLSKMKFVVQGDFVRIRSTHSSRCSSTCVWNV